MLFIGYSNRAGLLLREPALHLALTAHTHAFKRILTQKPASAGTDPKHYAVREDLSLESPDHIIARDPSGTAGQSSWNSGTVIEQPALKPHPSTYCVVF
jgi:hypothetical protein